MSNTHSLSVLVSATSEGLRLWTNRDRNHCVMMESSQPEGLEPVTSKLHDGSTAIGRGLTSNMAVIVTIASQTAGAAQAHFSSIPGSLHCSTQTPQQVEAMAADVGHTARAGSLQWCVCLPQLLKR